MEEKRTIIGGSEWYSLTEQIQGAGTLHLPWRQDQTFPLLLLVSNQQPNIHLLTGPGPGVVQDYTRGQPTQIGGSTVPARRKRLSNLPCPNQIP